MEFEKKTSILFQVAVFFIIGVIVTGIISYFALQVTSHRNVLSTTENFASQVADEVTMSVHQYPASKWLLEYWYEHADEMDIEYDVPMEKGTQTYKKCALLQERHPELQLAYATTEEIEALSDKDQKLYAEIVYSWLITRLNQIKQSYGTSFLYIVLTDDNYGYQYFLASAADPGAERGTEYMQVYTIGTVTPMEDNSSLQNGMRDACENAKHLSDAGDYMDYYAYMEPVGDQQALVGLTFSVQALKSSADSETLQGTTLSVIFQTLLALICLLMIYFFMIVPLKQVQENIRLYKMSKNSEIVVKNLSNIKSKNEIMELSKDISGLAEEIDKYLEEIENITTERERIEAELNVATQIQTSMLPRLFPAFPNRNEFDIYATMDPAREVGGDFYDFFMIDDDHLCMVIADVSGKGIPASLFMVVSKTLIKNQAQMGGSPSEILFNVNNQLCEGNDVEMFVTVWIGILEISTGKVTAANAGHEHPVIRRANGPFALDIYRHSPVVGAMECIPFKQHEFQLERGDTLFVYTDGLPEATNSDNQLFGTDRMLQVLNENPDVSLQEMLHAVKDRTMEFTGEADQFDDLTMLALRWNGPQG